MYTERRLYGPEFREYWGSGPWDDEPDEIVWTDVESGYLCAMRRNEMGAWCGYVAVTDKHPAHGIHAQDVGNQLYCHWGVTYSDFGAPTENPAETETVSNLWWFGFDCCHAYDLVPAFGCLRNPNLKDKYRDVAYVKDQINKLVAQLVAYATLQA